MKHAHIRASFKTIYCFITYLPGDVGVGGSGGALNQGVQWYALKPNETYPPHFSLRLDTPAQPPFSESFRKKSLKIPKNPYIEEEQTTQWPKDGPHTVRSTPTAIRLA